MTLDYAFRMGQYTDAQERRRKAACHSIYTLTTELSHLASTHEEGRSIPEDANKAVGILGELIENVKTLYRITAGDSSQQTEGR